MFLCFLVFFFTDDEFVTPECNMGYILNYKI